MKNIVYLTYDFFLDVDFPIVKELNKLYKLYWLVYIQIGTNQRFSPDEVKRFAEENQINLKLITVNNRFRSIKQLVSDFKTIHSLKKLKADLYYFEGFFNPYQPLLVKLFIKTSKTVIAIHDVVPHKKFRSLIARINEKLYFQLFKNYHLFSESQAAIYNKLYPGKNILIAKLILKDFGTSNVTPDKERINFLFFGSIQYNKGLDYLIQAANLLAGELQNFKITIAGKCDNFSEYMKMIEHPEFYDLDIRIIPNSEIPDLFAKAHYLVLPYRDVTQSGPLLIAYNYILPVIASDHPGFREYVTDKETGYLFESGNSKELYKTLKQAINDHPAKYSELKSNLAKFVDREIRIEKITKKYTDYFNTLIFRNE